MIELDDHRKANLEMMFANATDKDLIHELVRRGRLRQTEAHGLFWPELREEGSYMDKVRETVLLTIVRDIADDSENVVPALLQERPFDRALADSAFSPPKSVLLTDRQHVLTGNLVFLVGRKKAEDR